VPQLLELAAAKLQADAQEQQDPDDESLVNQI
jgi:hypothetical protein